MKLVVCLFLMLITAKECDEKKAQTANSNQTEVNAEMIEKRIQDIDMVKYLAVSRGFHLEITLVGDRLEVATSRDVKSSKSYELTLEDKRELMHIMSEINVSTLPELEAPSKAHQYDGAAIATLEMTKGEDSYKTMAFDHGKPPKAIQALVDKMISIKDRMAKQ